MRLYQVIAVLAVLLATALSAPTPQRYHHQTAASGKYPSASSGAYNPYSAGYYPSYHYDDGYSYGYPGYYDATPYPYRHRYPSYHPSYPAAGYGGGYYGGYPASFRLPATPYKFGPQVKQPVGGITNKRPIIAVVRPSSADQAESAVAAAVPPEFDQQSFISSGLGGAKTQQRPVLLVLNDALDQLTEEDFDISKLLGSLRPEDHHQLIHGDEHHHHDNNNKPDPELKPQTSEDGFEGATSQAQFEPAAVEPQQHDEPDFIQPESKPVVIPTLIEEEVAHHQQQDPVKNNENNEEVVITLADPLPQPVVQEEEKKQDEPAKVEAEPEKVEEQVNKVEDEPTKVMEAEPEKVEEPVKAEDEPVNKVEEPEKVQEQVKVEDEPVKVEEPQQVVQDEPAKVEEPSAEVEKVEEPVKVEDEPAKVEEPEKVEEQEQIKTTQDEPVKVDDEPAKVEDEPVKVEEPEKAQDEPAKVEEEPVKVDDEQVKVHQVAEDPKVEQVVKVEESAPEKVQEVADANQQQQEVEKAVPAESVAPESVPASAEGLDNDAGHTVITEIGGQKFDANGNVVIQHGQGSGTVGAPEHHVIHAPSKPGYDEEEGDKKPVDDEKVEDDAVSQQQHQEVEKAVPAVDSVVPQVVPASGEALGNDGHTVVVEIGGQKFDGNGNVVVQHGQGSGTVGAPEQHIVSPPSKPGYDEASAESSSNDDDKKEEEPAADAAGEPLDDAGHSVVVEVQGQKFDQSGNPVVSNGQGSGTVGAPQHHVIHAPGQHVIDAPSKPGYDEAAENDQAAVNPKPAEVWVELVDKDTPPVKIALPASEVESHDSHLVIHQKPEIWIQTDQVQPVEAISPVGPPQADSLVSQQNSEKDQPQIYNEEIIVSSPGLAVDPKPADSVQPAIGIPERVQPAAAAAAADEAVQAAVPEALVAHQEPVAEDQQKKDDAADCKIEYVLVPEDKVNDDDQQQSVHQEQDGEKPARFESRLNSRGNSKETRRV